MRSPESPGPRYRPRAVAPYPVVRTAVELLFAAAYVVGVYELVVAGGIALWPTATDDWILPMWIAAATISGLGLGFVRSLARPVMARLWPAGAADPYPALASFVVGASNTEPVEDALRRLAQLAAKGTGASTAAVRLVEPGGGLRLGARWPDEDEPAGRQQRGADHHIPVLDAGERLGELVLTAPPTRGLMPRDLRLAADVANAAALLLRNAELAARLAGQVRRQSEQAAELDRSRRRVLAARDAARAQLGREIGARVGEPLYQCSSMASALLDEDLEHGAQPRQRALAEMTALIDTAIGDFRKIVHGVYPAALTDHGLAAALENLLADLPRRSVFTARDLPRVAPRTEAGLYFCVAALVGSLSHADEDQPFEVHVEIDADTLSVALLDRARQPTDAVAHPEVLDALRDRIDALEGELRTSRTEDGLRYELIVPAVPAATLTAVGDTGEAGAS